MISRLSRRLTDSLERQKLFQPEDREIYEYGTERLLNYSLNILTTCVIGVLCGMPLQSLVFSLAFIVMRHNNGGAHAANDVRCYILSTLSVLASLYAVRWAVLEQIGPYAVVLALIPFTALVILLTPVEDSNKPIDEVERQVYRQRGIGTVFLCDITVIGFLMLHLFTLGCVVAAAVILASITLVIGWLKNRFADWKLDRY